MIKGVRQITYFWNTKLTLNTHINDFLNKHLST